MQQQNTEIKKLVKNDMFTEFTDRLIRGEKVYEKKFQRIKESRAVAKMELVYNNNGVALHGNDSNELKEAERSQYQTTLLKAVGDSIIRDLTANSMRFEWGANNQAGVIIKEAFDEIILKAYSNSNTERAQNKAYFHLIYSGVSITQPFTEPSSYSQIDPASGEIKNTNEGRIVSYNAYDPLSVILDWNADPSNIEGTSEFIIVRIGDFTKKELIRKFPDTDFSEVPDDNTGNMNGVSNMAYPSSVRTIEGNIRQLQQSAGMQKQKSHSLYEYYTRDGYRNVMLLEYGLVERVPNNNGIHGQIPFVIAPFMFDEDTPYGMSLYELLQPSLDILASAINNIADNNAITIKSPLFTFKDMLPQGFTLTDSSFYDVVNLDVDALFMGGNTPALDIKKMVTRLEVREITEGAMFLFNQALRNIWYVTGMNETSLGGVQDKQIRVAGVADMMSSSSMRSSNVIVHNVETYFMNPMIKHYARIFVLYYDDFLEFKKYKIDKEVAQNIQQNIRVVNGSFLPSDQFNEMQKTDALVAISQQDMSFDQVNVKKDWLKARGYVYPEMYMRDPLTMLEESQLNALVGLMKEKGAANVEQMLQQVVKQREDAATNEQQ